MKLNLDKNVMDLKGNPLSETLSNILANSLALATTGNPAKMITWAVNLTNDGEIDIDKSETRFLMDFVENNNSITNIVKAQILEEIEKLKE